MTAVFIILLIAFLILCYEFIQLRAELDSLTIEREYFLTELETMAIKLFKASGERTAWYHKYDDKINEEIINGRTNK